MIESQFKLPRHTVSLQNVLEIHAPINKISHSMVWILKDLGLTAWLLGGEP